MLGNAPHHGGVVVLVNAPHHGGVVMLGLAPHHRRRKTSRQCALPLPTTTITTTTPPRTRGWWRMGAGGGEGGRGGRIYCTPPASVHRADGGRSQDLESAPDPNRAGREPAAASHGLNRCSQATSSREL
jgi:hypothetical protein